MGIIYRIKEYLEIYADGLTIPELSKKLQIDKPTLRTTINREIKKDGIIEYAGFKREGGKVYRLKQETKGENKQEIPEENKELLKRNLDSNLFLMEFFQENKGKLQNNAFKKKDKFEKVIETIDETEKAIEGEDK